MIKTNNQTMGDKEIMGDFLHTQKLAGDSYNTFAGECVNPNLRCEFMKILGEEHDMQAEIFTEMQSRGWYNPEPADAGKVNQARQKFSMG